MTLHLAPNADRKPGCVIQLARWLRMSTLNRQKPPVQQRLFADDPLARGVHGTFSPNHKTSVHRWYPYLEGFSAEFVQAIYNEFAAPDFHVYDPFAGTGTTVAVAAGNGFRACYSEINPLMRLVIECKTNVLRRVACRKNELSRYFDSLSKLASDSCPNEADAQAEQALAFGKRNFFLGQRLTEIIGIKRALSGFPAPSPLFCDLARLALASIAVSCSEMKRAADLRYRTPNEAHPAGFSPLSEFREKLEQILGDVDESHAALPPVACLSSSALVRHKNDSIVDLLVTSPPYVNGTNYFRNTKLELWLAGYLKSEKELGAFRDQSLAAGINDISSRGRAPTRIDCVERVATALDVVAYDVRIPELIRRYFSDTALWLQSAHCLLRPGAVAIIDIGDSRFSGVHVPTDALIAEIAEQSGFKLLESRTVRDRKSNDRSALKQVLLVLKKPSSRVGSRKNTKTDGYRDAAVAFGRGLPHLNSPFCSRNWGHGLHSLCSYQGKLKPAIAHFLVATFTKPGDRVLDPFSGCGTIPLEAMLQGRQPIANDLQELAFILSRAKVESGRPDDALAVLDDLLRFVKASSAAEEITSCSSFGFNGNVASYFHADTLREILTARRYLKENPCNSWSQAIVYSSLLHILHGNRPYALSRQSHPVTPFKPTGPNEYRPMASRLREKVVRTLSLQAPRESIKGEATQLCFQQLAVHDVDVVITSPPFAASTRFFSSNWMRLWLAGWEPIDFDVRRDAFLERQQRDSLDVYYAFFERCAQWLRPGGRLIMHLGRSSKCNMGEELARRAEGHFEQVHLFDESVAGREKFGVRDQGATTAHQYLFLLRR